MTRLFFLKSVFQFLKTYKKRTILSMLGVLFGIFSLVAVGNISSAMNQKVKETLDKFGPNLLIIRAGEVHVTGRGVRQFGTAQTLKLRDAIAIKQFIKGIKEIVPIVEINYPLRYKQQITTMKIVGATSNIAKVRNLKLLEGHFYGFKGRKILK
ncbi:MacB-like periplasmic core domain protein [Candidatus Methanoperedenaceae archaeon GB37]|nr:MacB-like periplasmic core domain protein [Candidatus Methanoperedenaceae archaeon GB37]